MHSKSIAGSQEPIKPILNPPLPAIILRKLIFDNADTKQILPTEDLTTEVKMLTKKQIPHSVLRSPEFSIVSRGFS